MINVIHIDHPGGTDTERVLGGYTWNRANNWTVPMLDSHADILKKIPEAAEFDFVPVDPTAGQAEAASAAAAFLALVPGEEVVVEAPPVAPASPTPARPTVKPAVVASPVPTTTVEEGSNNA